MASLRIGLADHSASAKCNCCPLLTHGKRSQPAEKPAAGHHWKARNLLAAARSATELIEGFARAAGPAALRFASAPGRLDPGTCPGFAAAGASLLSSSLRCGVLSTTFDTCASSSCQQATVVTCSLGHLSNFARCQDSTPGPSVPSCSSLYSLSGPATPLTSASSQVLQAFCPCKMMRTHAMRLKAVIRAEVCRNLRQHL